MEIRVFGLVLLLVLCAALLADAQNWPDFKEKHVRPGMTERQCKTVMNQKKYPRVDGQRLCRERHSFIAATDNQIKAVCGMAGTRDPGNRNLFTSNNPFRVITCTTNQNKYYPCKYEGDGKTRTVTLTCENDLPVHYHEDTVIVQ